MVSLRARFVLPIESPPLENGVVRIENGCVAAIEPAGRVSTFVDLGDVALLPAFVNAHTHLEFSSLKAPLGVSGTPFPNWIRQVVSWRREQSKLDVQTNRVASIQRGLAESRGHGVAALGDIITPPYDSRSFADVQTCCVAFYELIGLSVSQTAELVSSAGTFLQQAGHPMLPGLSPHAPYTIGLKCLERLVALSVGARAPLAMHLAESVEEMQLLNTHSGPLVDLLEEWGAWDPAAVPRGCRPADYLERLAKGSRTLVIHGNYLGELEKELIADNRDRMSVVYCPRTHAYFQHERYPLGDLLHRGICVALGTDSRASNPNLSVLEEICHVVAAHPSVAPEVALQLGTINGARALGLDKQLGSLSVGKRADLVAVTILQASNDPYEALFSENPQVAQVYRSGRRLT